MRSPTLKLILACSLLGLLAWWSSVRTLREPGISLVSRVDPRKLLPGDVILRRGRDAVSAVVLAADQGSRFSHVGIIADIGQLVAVVHALPEDEDHPEGQVLVQSIGDFLAPEKASEFAIYRLDRPSKETAKAAAQRAVRYFREHRRFDADFRLETPDELYCSELVWRAFRESGIDLIDKQFAHLALPLGSGEFVLPSSFTKSRHLVLLTQKDTGP